jgi:hypothetical protein
LNESGLRLPEEYALFLIDVFAAKAVARQAARDHQSV